MIEAGEVWIEGAAPVLAAPVLKQLDEAAIGAVTDWVFNQLVLIIDIAAIKLINSAHQSAYDSASLQLAVIAQEKGITSDAFIQARKTAALAMSAFTEFGK